MEQEAIARVQSQRAALANSVEKTNTQGSDGEARGFAIAQTAIATVKGQASALAQLAVKLAMGDIATRAAFLKYLNKHLTEMRAHVKSTSPDGKIKNGNPVFKWANTSAATRLSELGTVAKAITAGYVLAVSTDPDTKVPNVNAMGEWIAEQSFHTIVGEARAYLGSQAKGRGRPKTPFGDKLKKFMQDNAEGEADVKYAAEFIEAMLKTMAHKAQAK